MRRATRGRWLAALLSAGLLAGCAEDATLRNPQTGASETCAESLQGLDPWSQKDACVADRVAHGWTRADPD